MVGLGCCVAVKECRHVLDLFIVVMRKLCMNVPCLHVNLSYVLIHGSMVLLSLPASVVTVSGVISEVYMLPRESPILREAGNVRRLGSQNVKKFSSTFYPDILSCTLIADLQNSGPAE